MNGLTEKIRGYVGQWLRLPEAERTVHAMDALIKDDPDPAVFYHLSSLRRALLNWYPFPKGGRALDAAAGYGALTGLLTESFEQVDALAASPEAAEVISLRYRDRAGLRVICAEQEASAFEGPVSGHGLPSGRTYDLILFSDLRKTAVRDLPSFLSRAESLLTPDGSLLIAFRNRNGFKYACGACDDYVAEPYAVGDLFAPDELADAAGRVFPEVRICAAMPDIRFVQAVYTDGFLPDYSVRDRILVFDAFGSPLTANESTLYDEAVRDGTFLSKADVCLLECRRVPQERHVIHAALSTDRGPADSFATILYSDGTAEKKALYPAGSETLLRSCGHLEALAARGIPVVPQEPAEVQDRYGAQGSIESTAAVRMPLIRETQMMDHLAALVRAGDREAFLGIFRELYDNILRSSEPAPPGAAAAFAPELFAGRPILARGYIDMIPYNCFRSEAGIRYYDQEFLLERCPAYYILFRAVRYTYIHIPEAEGFFPQAELCSALGLTPEIRGACLDRENAFVNENRHVALYPQVYRWAVRP